MSALRRLDRAWMGGGSAEVLASLRILIGLFAVIYLAVRAMSFRSVSTFESHQFAPVGVLRVLDGPIPSLAWDALLIAAIVAGIGFVTGYRYRVSGLAFAILLLIVISYRNSWGQIFHVENLLVLHVLILGIVPAAHALSLDARRGASVPGDSALYGWPVQLMCVVTVLAYVIAGVAKLDRSGLDWALGDVLRNQVAYDNLRKEVLGDIHSPIGGWLVAHGWVFPPLASATLVVELGAPIALLGGWWARGWVVAAWGFHMGILALMAILFPYQLLGIAFLPFLRIDLSRVWTRLAPYRERADWRGRSADQPA